MLDLSKIEPGTWALILAALAFVGNLVLALVNKRTPSVDVSASTQQSFMATVVSENTQLRAEKQEAEKEIDSLKGQLALCTAARDKAIAKAGDLEQILRGKEAELAQKQKDLDKLLRKHAGLNGHDDDGH